VSAEDSGNMTYKNLESGKSIPIYSVIRSGPEGYAEIKLAQNKTIKIFSSTTISLSKFQVDSTVNLKTGKIRAIFNKILKNDDLKIKTDTGIAAVRGTDFGVIYSSGQGGISLMEVFVKEGIVNLSTLDGRSVDIPQGYSSSINSYLGRVEIEDPRPISENEFSKYFEPQQIQQTPDIQKQPKEESVPPQELPKQPTIEPSKPESTGTPKDQGLKFDFGWEISSQNINGVVWNKILLSPIFKVGEFGIGLYLVSYWDGKNNIYDTSKWYNSYEYNFGFVGNDFLVTDFLDDLFKKVLFISYGSKGKNVFIRVGSIPDMTLGHGFVMDRYSNMLNFPAIRRIGLQFDLDFGHFGFESAVSDLSRSRLFGGRMFVRPLYGTLVLGNIAIGISGVADLESFSTNGQTFEGNPTVFFTGIDLDFPVVDIGVFSLKIFSDIAKSGIYINDLGENPYLSQLFISNGLNQGFNFLDGEGLSFGVNGYIVGIVPYRIEYRRINGKFLPSYFDTLYDAQKVQRLEMLILSNLPPFNGILGNSGVVMPDLAEATIQYEQLWPEENGDISINRLIGRFKVSKEIVKMITGLPSYAVVSYQRNNIPSFSVFFNDILKDSTVTIELAYSIDPSMDVSISYRRFYVSSTEYQDSVSIQLRSSVFGELGF
ncbi:MAG: FecR domain-containing protein, partial [Brevinematia bacterium]